MIERGDYHWMSLGACHGFGVKSPDDDFWFDAYEASVEVAKNIDRMCLTCPVITACLKYGVDNKLDGVWGGVYLQNGKVSESKNKHKGEDVWQSLRNLLALP